MRLLRSAQGVTPIPCVLTIGTFDGVHLGHQAMFTRLVEQAKQAGVASAVIFFEPHPKEYFSKEKKPYRLMNLREKLSIIRQYGVDFALCLSFNHKLATISPDEFITRIVLTAFKPTSVIVGEDFYYGYQRQGNVSTLKQAGDQHGFSVEALPLLCTGQEKISSTYIRSLLARADFTSVRELLGYDYFMIGRVIKGHQRGQAIGVPTANVLVKPVHRPLIGVYCVRVTVGSKEYSGVANIGFRPTVDGQNYTLEAHLFHFNGDLYGQRIKVAFIDKIRDEKRFDSFDELVTQIKSDINVAKQRLEVND